MDMKIIEINGETYTRFKVLRSQFQLFKSLLAAHGIKKPTKVSSRYVYFEAKGDYLNAKKEGAV